MTVRTTKDAINIREELERLKGNREDFTVSGTFTVSGKMDVNADGDITFGDDEVFFDASTGNVGIGTTSPSYSLDVVGDIRIGGSTTADLFLQESGNTGESRIFFGDVDSSTIARISYNHTSNYMATFVNGSERFRIDSSGNVGIGTTSPGGKLDVAETDSVTYSSSAVQGDLIISRLNSANTVNQVVGLEFDVTGWSGSTTGVAGISAIQTGTNASSAALAFQTRDAGTIGERMRIDSSGNVGIGTTSPADKLHVSLGAITLPSLGGDVAAILENTGNTALQVLAGTTGIASIKFGDTDAAAQGILQYDNSGDSMRFVTAGGERVRVDSSGNMLVGGAISNPHTAGGNPAQSALLSNGRILAAATSDAVMELNRTSTDGTIVNFRQAATIEGSISVSGTTVSYNGGHLSRWSRLPVEQGEPTLYKGTVMTNLDTMVNWDGEENEQLNETEVSSVEGDPNVAGLFVAWDESDELGDYYLAMTGDLVIRIAEGVTVQRGDLLMSAGDGTAKPQGDDIVRSKTIAKVTSTNVSHTYPDGSYAVPCVVMAC